MDSSTSRTRLIPGSNKVDLLLGIDFGTGGCKISVLDTRGNLVASASEELTTSHPRPGWAEQQPADWYRVLLGCFSKLGASGLVPLERIVALALDGSTHNAVLLDRQMIPLRPTIMWTDQRSTEEVAWLEQNHGEEIFRIGYQRPAPTWTLPQLLWLRKNEPEVFGKLSKILFLKDYVRYLLTGVVCTDHIEAQGSLFYDMAERRWSAELCAMAGVPLGSLPELVSPVDRVGRITAKAAGETGLREGIPVICGSSDSAVEDYAAGAISEGQAVIKLATAGNFNVMTSRAIPNPKTLTYSHVVPGMWYSVTATNAAAICMRWFRENFCESDKRDGAATGVNPYELMGLLAAKSTAGARGIFFHPYLQGERSPYWDSTLRGSFTGLSMAHTRGDLIRAVMEGVAFSLRDCRRVLDGMKLPITEIRLIGGGAKDPLWAQIVCDVLEVPVNLPTHSDASAGSALLAGVGIGIFSDERDAVNRCVRLSAQLQPQPDAASRYSALFSTYQRIHDAMAAIYPDGVHSS